MVFLAQAPSSRERRLTEKKKFGTGKESLKITSTPILQPKWSFKNQVQSLSQLAYYPPPTWNKTQSSYQSLSGLHDLILAASSSSIPLPLSFCTQASGICCFWFLAYFSLPEGLCSCCSSARNALPLVFALLVLLVDLAHRSLPLRGSLWPLVWSSCTSSKSLFSL